jgi:hypothetical protein
MEDILFEWHPLVKDVLLRADKETRATYQNIAKEVGIPLAALVFYMTVSIPITPELLERTRQAHQEEINRLNRLLGDIHIDL